MLKLQTKYLQLHTSLSRCTLTPASSRVSRVAASSKVSSVSHPLFMHARMCQYARMYHYACIQVYFCSWYVRLFQGVVSLPAIIDACMFAFAPLFRYIRFPVMSITPIGFEEKAEWSMSGKKHIESRRRDTHAGLVEKLCTDKTVRKFRTLLERCTCFCLSMT
jgi:hypothetical protein